HEYPASRVNSEQTCRAKQPPVAFPVFGNDPGISAISLTAKFCLHCQIFIRSWLLVIAHASSSHTVLSACKKISVGCAPESAYFPAKMKNGTPRTPTSP